MSTEPQLVGGRRMINMSLCPYRHCNRVGGTASILCWRYPSEDSAHCCNSHCRLCISVAGTENRLRADTDLPIPCCGRPWSVGRRWFVPSLILIWRSVEKNWKLENATNGWQIVVFPTFPWRHDIITLEQNIWLSLQPSMRYERCF